MAHRYEPDKPALEIQIFRLNKAIQDNPQGDNITNNYLRKLGKKNPRDLTQKECADLIIELTEKDSGGDKQ
ncbi:MAG: hypothetical protein ACXADO_00535 [Candidatus Thorarchaeota archaeon]|jgi:hypothetical protein